MPENTKKYQIDAWLKETKLTIACFLIILFSALQIGKVSAQTILDDFSDGNYTASPIWTVQSGTYNVSFGELSNNTGSSTNCAISTPFISQPISWQFDLRAATSIGTTIRYFLFQKDNANPTSGLTDGYYIWYDQGRYIEFRRLDNSVPVTLISYDMGLSSTSYIKFRIIRDCNTGTWELFTGAALPGTSRGIVTDNTYSLNQCQYQGIWINTTSSGQAKVDNIYYTILSGCINPTFSGSISNSQCNSISFDPTIISSISIPNCYSGNLEYKWQYSINSGITWNDIVASNNSTYDPSVITQTTWYRRLARVDCMPDWSSAAISNIIPIIVGNLSFDGTSINDTVYNQLGNASFAISTNYVLGVTYQWQVSSDAGASWSNLTNGGYYSNVTDTILQITNPIYSMNGYQYRCVASNSCGSVSTTGKTLSVIQIASFSNTTTQACGTDYTNSFGNFTRTIAVSGLPIPLGTSSGEYVLRQIDVKLGSSSCKKDLRTYYFRLTAPDGTNYDFINGLTTSGNPVWVDLHLRDHNSLEKISEYSTNTQDYYFPFSIGYYAVETDGSFQSVFNGKNPNGNWVFSIRENVTTGNEISFESVKLHFGPQFSIVNASSNDACTSPYCKSTSEITIGTNNGYVNGEPAASFPGTTTDGCGWNGANNNSAWFKFTASSSTAYITLSGITNPSPGSYDTQPIVFSRTGDCSNMGTLSVPTGGCSDDESINNVSYKSSNGGGIGAAGGVYFDGISANAEFNLSGLTVGKTYYLYVDGNGGTTSTFYIEMPFGAQQCTTPLPIELVSFDANCLNNNNIKVSWTTASEKDNDYYTLEKSNDLENWDLFARVNGAGNSNSPKNYSYIDIKSGSVKNYYRLKQTDYDGNFTYSSVIATNCYPSLADRVSVYYDESNLQLSVFLNTIQSSTYQFTVYDILGRPIVMKEKEILEGNSIFNIPVDLVRNGCCFISVADIYGKSVPVTIKFVR